MIKDIIIGIVGVSLYITLFAFTMMAAFVANDIGHTFNYQQGICNTTMDSKEKSVGACYQASIYGTINTQNIENGVIRLTYPPVDYWFGVCFSKSDINNWIHEYTNRTNITCYIDTESVGTYKGYQQLTNSLQKNKK